jgi:hypothetical protein
MAALAYNEAYLTALETDLLLDTDTVWQGASDELKDIALLRGRYFIDAKFSCSTLEDLEEIPDELKLANAYLASDYISDQTIFDSQSAVKRNLVKAGSAMSEKEYLGGYRNKPKSFDIVKSILQNLCTSKGSTVSLMRA